MPLEIVLPKLGLTMEEATVSSWVKEIGEFIEADDVVMEVETDKATMEVESSDQGYLTKKLFAPGETVEVGAAIAVLSENRDGEGLEQDNAKKNSGTQPSEEPSVSLNNQPNQPEVDEKRKRSNPFLSGSKIRISPAARKLAKEKGLNVNTVSGSGPRGRVILKDIHQQAAEKVEKVSEEPRNLLVIEEEAEDKVVPLSNMRKIIADRMTDSFKNVPQFTVKRGVDCTAINNARANLNELNSSEEKVSLNDFIIKAVAEALEKHPKMNAYFVEKGEESHLLEKGQINIGLAVAIDDGLVVPVIPKANELNLLAIAKKRSELVKKAQSGALTPEEMSGGTFSISNLGGFQVDEFTAIVNPPESGILAIGTANNTSVINDNMETVIKPIMQMTASFDHRIIDGAQGASFLQTVVENLQSNRWKLI